MGQISIGERGAVLDKAANEGRREAATPGPGLVGQKTLFDTYFSRLFACVYSLTGDRAATGDVVTEAFVQVLPPSLGANEDDFVVELFAKGRDLARATCGSPSSAGSLTEDERELLAFIFEAQLTGEQVCRLTGTTERAIPEAVVGALRKAQAELSLAHTPSIRPA